MPMISLLLAAMLQGALAGLPGAAETGLPVVLTQTATNEAGQPLSGTAWLLESLDGFEVDPAIGSSLEFDDDGAVFGNGGCNRFRGGATVDGNALEFGELASTMMACEEPNTRQEAAFHAALAATATYRIEETDLVLLNAEEAVVARLTPAP